MQGNGSNPPVHGDLDLSAIDRLGYEKQKNSVVLSISHWTARIRSVWRVEEKSDALMLETSFVLAN